MKSHRHKKILELIEEYTVETQEELIDLLREHGYDVTQATVSRDIKQLRLIKTSTGEGKYRYTLPRGDDSPVYAKFNNILYETVISVENAQNIVVIKTYSGMANAAAAALDSLISKSIVGSLAGDDTVFVVLKNNTEAENFTNLIKTVIKIA